MLLNFFKKMNVQTDDKTKIGLLKKLRLDLLALQRNFDNFYFKQILGYYDFIGWVERQIKIRYDANIDLCC